MSSVLTNVGAMTALRTLQDTNKNMSITQDRVSTGMKVATAKADAAVWAIASSMRSEMSATKTVIDSLGVAQSAVSLARGSAELIVDKLETLKQKVLQRVEYTANGDTTNANRVTSEITELANTISSVVSNATFNTINLLSGSSNATFNITESGGTFTVTNQSSNLTTAGSINGTSSVSDVETALNSAQNAASQLGAAQNRLETQQEFAKVFADALKEGVGTLVDADMTEESARLQALQVQQQLGVQALSIANQAPQALLSLFR